VPERDLRQGAIGDGRGNGRWRLRVRLRRLRRGTELSAVRVQLLRADADAGSDARLNRTLR